MNFLNGKNCYLAGPITADSTDGQVWRDQITPKLKEFGINVADPTKQTVNGVGEVADDKILFRKLIKERKWEECKERFYQVARKDLKCVDRADFLVIEYLPKLQLWAHFMRL
jgi:hypothetical protein